MELQRKRRYIVKFTGSVSPPITHPWLQKLVEDDLGQYGETRNRPSTPTSGRLEVRGGCAGMVRLECSNIQAESPTRENSEEFYTCVRARKARTSLVTKIRHRTS